MQALGQDEPATPLRPAGSADGPEGSGRRRRHSRLRGGLGLALGLLAGAAVVLLLGTTDGLSAALARPPHPAWLLFLPVCLVLLLAADAASLAVLAARAEEPRSARASYGRLGSVALEANFIGGVTSFFGLEIPYQAAALRGLGMSWAAGMSAILAKGLSRASLLALTAILAVAVGGSPLGERQRLVVFAVTAALAAAWSLVLLLSRRPRTASHLPRRLRLAAERFAEACSPLRSGGWRLWAPVLLLQVLYWLATFAIVPASLLALGWEGSPVRLVWGLAITQILMSFSPLPGGAGVAEAGFLGLVAPGIPDSMGMAGLVYWRIATWAVPVLVGGVLLGVRAGRDRWGLRGRPAERRDGHARLPASRSLKMPVGGAGSRSLPSSGGSPASSEAAGGRSCA